MAHNPQRYIWVIRIRNTAQYTEQRSHPAAEGRVSGLAGLAAAQLDQLRGTKTGDDDSFAALARSSPRRSRSSVRSPGRAGTSARIAPRVSWTPPDGLSHAEDRCRKAACTSRVNSGAYQPTHIRSASPQGTDIGGTQSALRVCTNWRPEQVQQSAWMGCEQRQPFELTCAERRYSISPS
jgi:hypothetical protein